MIILFIVIVVVITVFSFKSFVTSNAYPTGTITSYADPSNWNWVSECQTSPKFILDSEWPSFLQKEIWNSCQGCKSAAGRTDSSNKTFQIIGDWMRIGCIDGDDSTSISTSEARNFWFNPPRNGTDDRPLELEWYMYMDASSWGKTRDELLNSDISSNNWSAFWSFPHGIQVSDSINFSWPHGGELDFAEWLPSFGAAGKGLTSGIHNTSTGAFPPCCIRKGDKVVVSDFDGAPVTHGDKEWFTNGFNSWGFNYVKKYEPYIYDYIKKQNLDYNHAMHYADVVSYNNVIHTYVRMTTKQIAIWANFYADPQNPPQISITPDMSNEEADSLLSMNGFVMVSRAFADFGSSDDKTYDGVSSTNWHQNFFFVWSAILSQGNTRSVTPIYKPIVFYLSDIMIKGGGNYKKAQAPPNTPPDLIAAATTMSDPTAEQVCNYRYSGGRSCYSLF